MSYQVEQERTFRFLRLPSEARRRRVRPLIAWLRRLAPLLGVAALGAAALAWLLTAPAFALSDLQIRTGERIETAQLERRLAELRGRNLFRVDLGQVSELLLEEPWIRELRVVKQLPNRLVIAVEEHEPVAVLRQASQAPGDLEGDERWFLDRRGERIAPVERAAEELLLLSADHASTRDQRVAALDLVERLDATAGAWHRRGLEAIRLVSTGDLELRFRGRDYPMLVLPETAMTALGHYERLERPLGAQGVVPRSVDLRFDGRVLVAARDVQEVG